MNLDEEEEWRLQADNLLMGEKMKRLEFKLSNEITLLAHAIFFGRGKCKYVITWYICGVQGDTPYDFWEKHNLGRRNEAKTHATHKGEP